MRRFFADDSFWNQPIPAGVEVDPESATMLRFVDSRNPRGFWLNLEKWTIPIYEANHATPRRRVYNRFHPNDKREMIRRSIPYLTANHPLGHGHRFAKDTAVGHVPIPDGALTNPENDRHIALVDWENAWIWDMWAAQRSADGDWEAKAGMEYRADGSGVFERSEFSVHNGESIHPCGPSRAAGVPALAGTILHEEILAGHIEQRLAFATPTAALQRFVSPPANNPQEAGYRMALEWFMLPPDRRPDGLVVTEELIVCG